MSKNVTSSDILPGRSSPPVRAQPLLKVCCGKGTWSTEAGRAYCRAFRQPPSPRTQRRNVLTPLSRSRGTNRQLVSNSSRWQYRTYSVSKGGGRKAEGSLLAVAHVRVRGGPFAASTGGGRESVCPVGGIPPEGRIDSQTAVGEAVMPPMVAEALDSL